MKTNKNVISLISELSGRGKLKPQDSLRDDAGLDSLSMAALLIKIEHAFNIELNESDMDPFDLSSVADVISLVKRYINE